MQPKTRDFLLQTGKEESRTELKEKTFQEEFLKTEMTIWMMKKK